MELHPEILRKNGKPEFAVLPYEEYEAIERILADAQDLVDLREAVAQERDKPGNTSAEARKALGL